MTLAPLHSVEVRGVEGKPGELARLCAVPGCISLAQQRHHLWPRSFLRGQPYEWVRLPDGKVIQNTVGLCVRHHAMVTGGPDGHAALITLDQGILFWCPRREERSDSEGRMTWWEMGEPLYPQPAGITVPDEHPEDAADHGTLLPGQTCPTCGYRKPRPSKPGPKRKARSWVILVPDDAEIGGEVLDDWVDDFAALLGLDGGTSRLRRYHVLCSVLAWAMQNKPNFVRDVREAEDA